MAVFVIQKPRPGGVKKITYDISPALEFGTFVYVFDENDQPGLTPVPSSLKALRALGEFSSKDFLLWAGGDPCAFAIAVMAASWANNGSVNFLRWERGREFDGERKGRGYYVPVKLQLNLKGTK